MQTFRVRTLAPLAAFATLLAACDGGGTSVPTPSAVTPATSVSQQATPGATVAEPPTVRVVDAQGQPIPGVGVTFAVTAGGGTLGTPLATTDAAGVASATSWTLGSSLGVNTVTATVTGLPVVTFTATALDPCDVAPAYTLFTTLQAGLSVQDCRLPNGEFEDFYTVSLAEARAVTFTLSSATFDTWLELFDASGNYVALNDDDDATETTNSAIRVFAPAGTYFLGASSYDPAVTGSYTLGSSVLAGNVACQFPWVVPGVQLNGQITTTDCTEAGYYSDIYMVVLYAGEQLQVSMQSSAVDAYLILFGANGIVAEDDDSGGGSNALMTFTATETGVYAIDAGTLSPGETGAYTLAVTRSGGSASMDAGSAVRAPLSREALRLDRDEVVSRRSAIVREGRAPR